jgi:hypothetical protein
MKNKIIMDGSKIMIKAVLVNKVFIPIWEFTHENCEMYGDVYRHESHRSELFKDNFVDVYYDINTKEIQSGIKVEIYPKENNGFKVGEEVYISERGYGIIEKTEITEIVYQPDYNHVKWGEQAESDYGRWCDEKFDYDKLYHIVVYKEYYKIKGSDKLIWSHQLYRLKK